MKYWRGLTVFLLTVSVLPAQNVLTWNVGLLSVAGVDVVPRVVERSRQIPQVLAQLATEHDLDVIALQEVWDDGVAASVSSALSSRGYRSLRPVEKTWTGVGSGLLVLWSSRWALVHQTFVPWSVTAGWEGLSRKGLAHVTLQATTGERLDVLTFHMGAVDAPAGVVTDARQRDAWTAQLAQLAGEWATVEPESRSVLLGDANVGPGYGQEQFDLLKGLEGLVVAKAGGVTWDPANPLVKAGVYPNEPAATIDHVFWRAEPGFEPVSRVLDLGLSDHYAVLVTGPPRR